MGLLSMFRPKCHLTCGTSRLSNEYTDCASQPGPLLPQLLDALQPEIPTCVGFLHSPCAVLASLFFGLRHTICTCSNYPEDAFEDSSWGLHILDGAYKIGGPLSQRCGKFVPHTTSSAALGPPCSW